MIVAVPAGQAEKFRALLKRYSLGDVRVVQGGRTRAESVRNGVLSVSEDCQWIMVHDAARPLVSKRSVRRLIHSAKKTGAAILIAPVISTVKRMDARHKYILRTEDRSSLVLAQTPQIFKRDLLMARYQALGSKALLATDEAALFDGCQIKVNVVPGDERNIKITTPTDIDLFKFYMEKK